MSSCEWRPVVGYETLYEVSDDGQVRSLDRIDKLGRLRKGRVLALRDVASGYRQVTLCDGRSKKQTLVHRIVCEAFHGTPKDPKSQVDHLNHDRGDDRASNLEWVSCKENIRRIEYNPGNSKPVLLITDDGKTELFSSVKEAVSAGYSESEIYKSTHSLPMKPTGRSWVFQKKKEVH